MLLVRDASSGMYLGACRLGFESCASLASHSGKFPLAAGRVASLAVMYLLTLLARPF